MSFIILTVICVLTPVIAVGSTLLIQRSRKQKAVEQDKLTKADRLYWQKHNDGLVAELASALALCGNAGKHASGRVRDSWNTFYIKDETGGNEFSIRRESPLGMVLETALLNYRFDAALQQNLELHLEQLRGLQDVNATDDARLEAGVPLLQISNGSDAGKRGQLFLVQFLGATASEVRGIFNQVTEKKFLHLMAELRKGGEQQYVPILQHRIRMADWARSYGTKCATLPGDWNQVVADKVEVPKLSDFAGFRNYEDMPAGTVALMAAEALRQDSRLLGKIVLAYANERSSKARSEVPDGLLTEVVKMVERKNAETRTAQQAVS